MNDKFYKERLEEARVVMETYASKDRVPLVKDAKNCRIWDEVDIRKMSRWPWYAKYLLPFRKATVCIDSTDDVICAVYSKKLFGRTYITKTRMERVAGLVVSDQEKP